MLDIHRIVKKLGNNIGDVMDRSELQDIIYPEMMNSEEEEKRLSQWIYALKGYGVLLAVRNGLYLIIDPREESSNVDKQKEFLIDANYWRIVKRVIQEEVGREWIIGGEKALELIMRDYAPSYELLVYTRDVQKKVRLTSGHTIVFRSMKTGKKTQYKNAFPILKKYSSKIELNDSIFHILSTEAALLDALTIHNHAEGISDSLILKFLKRYGASLDKNILAEFVSIRYIRSINRLRTIAQDMGNEKLYEMTLDIIKREGGGCFLTL